LAKVLEATCEDGIVTLEGQEIEVDLLLSEGVAPSQGVLIIDGNKTYYVARTSPDLKSSLETLTEAINSIADVLTAIGAGMTGPTTAPPGTLAADVTAIQALATELEDLGESLK
jgi:hypothetical protein